MDEDKPFAGHAPIVTGATRGNDRAIVLELARRGAAVAFNYAQSVEAATEFNSGIEALGIIAVQCHVAQMEDVKGLYNADRETFGRIDFLANNAGITRNNRIPSAQGGRPVRGHRHKPERGAKRGGLVLKIATRGEFTGVDGR